MDEATETTLDRLDQIAERSAANAAEVERLGAGLADLRDRFDRIDERIAALLKAQERSAEQVERLAASMGWEPRVSALDERIGANAMAAARVEEAVAPLAPRISRLDERVRDQGNELAREIAAERQAREADAERLTREQRELRALADRGTEVLDKRIEEVAKGFDRLEPLERSRGEVKESLLALEARVDRVAAEREAIEEIARRTEAHAEAQASAVAAQVKEARAEVATWTTRIEEQVGMLREARTLADRMRQEAAALEAAQEQVAKSQQAAEARVDAALERHKQDSAEEWTEFLARREREHAQARRDREAEAASLDERLDGLETRIAEQLDALRQELDRRLEPLVEDDLQLRRLLAELGGRIGAAWSEATGVAEEGLQADARPVLAEERRQALRRAMRARRDEAGDAP